ncbi:plasmid partitioning protein RepB [Rhodobacter sphaeroides]|jgi:ParB family chromosome partitioning protein|uniref:Rep B partitioning protein/ParB-like protein n=1 Tax=Cereibacter sphaeroides (strain ATCC 17023 / DSM 158 / JCM 6121 / CCUG 31486 / LMG 2827 / NBRC 12203 / NCIMB 8253 / ATH 2.4.1.) TaxID=272943 RepID=Q3IUZ7_CERS4|nr:plasmid partitioning protein RepB [Cereibacter sphaeroides]ABA81637.1 Rep B partitioning protein/ParB-like protein [Cereibacter sphaeroides 2.4.1]AMJ49871.1 plasmid partitioning protein RepB [Cereibacter sphaeroides]ANS36582.1 plasmid partitioning protein RepB [Cereibacter sphaeroides]ATN65647.1 plasmid partitioning protein RepB [Cereibacter sphaeroides]AXC64208.1 plasmid partitioning protein RepB [Cereibacter sphaeroides 2.4.1]
MTDSKKKRMSMLDSLAAAGTPPAPGSMMSSNRALRSARDAVDAHHVWELDPVEIQDERYSDRLDPKDVHDLRASIEQNGQTVPILVRRHPTETDRYLLVYGRRRLEAIRASDKVKKVRALIAILDDTAALRAQVSENTGRRDLSYIERALFAQELLDSGFGSQAQIAEVLNATRSAVSMSISVAKAIGTALAHAIGPAHGIGRPRWESLAKELPDAGMDMEELCRVASDARGQAAAREQAEGEPQVDPSVTAFEAVVRYVRKTNGNSPAKKPRPKPLLIEGAPAGAIKRSARALRLELTDVDDAFAQWLDANAQDVLDQLHDRWRRET